VLDPDREIYWSVLRSYRPNLTQADLQRWTKVGELFDWIYALVWATHEDSAQWYIQLLREYQPALAAWTRVAKSEMVAN
jgi:hypothetical protein